MKVTNIDLYKYFNEPKPNKQARGFLHGIFFDHDLDDLEMCPKRVHPMMLVIPGGGYCFVSRREANPVCLAFANEGFNCFWLDYSISPYNHYPTMLIEAMMALTYLHKKAKYFHSNPKQIAVSGFSAGGHLAGMLGTLSEEEKTLFPPLLKSGAKAAALVLGYPVIGPLEKDCSSQYLGILMGEGDPNPDRMSLLRRLDNGIPPTYIWSTKEDTTVPPDTNAKPFAEALKERKIPCLYRLYEHGPHGLTSCDPNTYLAKQDHRDADAARGWIREAVQFLASNGVAVIDR